MCEVDWSVPSCVREAVVSASSLSPGLPHVRIQVEGSTGLSVPAPQSAFSQWALEVETLLCTGAGHSGKSLPSCPWKFSVRDFKTSPAGVWEEKARSLVPCPQPTDRLSIPDLSSPHKEHLYDENRGSEGSKKQQWYPCPDMTGLISASCSTRHPQNSFKFNLPIYM